MAKDISKLFGTPSTREGGIKQHKELRDKLRRNGVYSLNSMNRGYLVLRHDKVRMYPQLRTSKKVDIWHNILQSAKPTGMFIMASKV